MPDIDEITDALAGQPATADERYARRLWRGATASRPEIDPVQMLGKAGVMGASALTGPVVAALIRYSPALATTLLGGALAGSSTAAGEPDIPTSLAPGQRDPKSSTWWIQGRHPPPEKPAELMVPTRPEIPPFQEPNYPPNASERTKTSMLNRARSAYDAKWAKPQSDYNQAFGEYQRKSAELGPNYDRAREDYKNKLEAQAADDLIYKTANQSLYEMYPTETSMLPYLFGALGGATVKGARSVANAVNAARIGKMEDAMTKAGPILEGPIGRSRAAEATRLKALTELEHLYGPKGTGRMLPDNPTPGSPPWLGATAGTMIPAGEGGVLPAFIDQRRLPPEAHANKEMEGFAPWADKFASGILPGLTFGGIGATMPLRTAPLFGKPLVSSPPLEEVKSMIEALKARAPRVKQ